MKESIGSAVADVLIASHHTVINVTPMLYYTLVFLVIALVAGVLGFTGIAGASASIAQTLFYVFLVLLVVSLIVGAIRGSGRPKL